MLYRVGDIDLFAVDAGFRKRAVEHVAGRAHERFAREVFLVAGLLADQHQPGLGGAFAKHGLCGVLPQRAGAAVGGFRA